MKADDVQLGTYIDQVHHYGVEHNDKDPKFKASDGMRK